MGEFFGSVSRAFARNQASAPGVALGVFLVGVALAAWLWFSARRNAAANSEALFISSGLSLLEFDALKALSARASESIEVTLASLATFERVTAVALDERADAGLIQRLRSKLHFDQLPKWAPLFSSRELRLGAVVHLGQSGQTARVLKTDETSFTLSVAAKPTAELTPVEVLVIHDGEARYQLRCSLIRLTEVAGQWQLELKHDESPHRIQMRSYVRVPGQNIEVTVTPVSARGASMAARLVDVSAGGALLRAPKSLSVGELVDMAFALGDHKFPHVGAVVVGGSANRASGTFKVQLEFSGIEPELRDRLVGSINALSAR